MAKPEKRHSPYLLMSPKRGIWGIWILGQHDTPIEQYETRREAEPRALEMMENNDRPGVSIVGRNANLEVTTFKANVDGYWGWRKYEDSPHTPVHLEYDGADWWLRTLDSSFEKRFETKQSALSWSDELNADLEYCGIIVWNQDNSIQRFKYNPAYWHPSHGMWVI